MPRRSISSSTTVSASRLPWMSLTMASMLGVPLGAQNGRDSGEVR
jgi:hypothetical protein